MSIDKGNASPPKKILKFNKLFVGFCLDLIFKNLCLADTN